MSDDRRPDRIPSVGRRHKRMPQLPARVVIPHLKLLEDDVSFSLIFRFLEGTFRHIGQQELDRLLIVIGGGIDEIDGLVIARVGIGGAADRP